MISGKIIALLSVLLVAGFFILFLAHNHFFDLQGQTSQQPEISSENSNSSADLSSLNNDYLDDSLNELDALESAEK